MGLDSPTIVLLSGGLDSAVLAVHEAQSRAVHPVYVAAGLAWEHAEQRIIRRFLAHSAVAAPPYPIAPLVTLECTVRDLYPATHWALTGTPPAYDTPDEDVYLHGRNVMLLAKTAVYASMCGISRITVATLAGNPFPDATPAFFAGFGAAVSRGLDAPIAFTAPFASWHKEDVVRTGAALGVPFELTLSCMNPADGRPCGACSKCRERRDAFRAAGVDDPPYVPFQST